MSIKSVYAVQGMTCENCVKTITEKTSALSGVLSVRVNREKNEVEIEASRKVELDEVRKALADLPKYTVLEKGAALPQTREKSWLEIYKPLLTIFAFILLVSLAYQVQLGEFDSHLFMNHLMAGFFIGLSFFKFLNLNAFADSFSSYDPIAQKWNSYGFVYPFVELALGLMFVAGVSLTTANAVTIFILSVTTFGVYRRLKSKSAIQCACLGTTFSLPLSNVTIAENATMIAMATYGLVASIF